MANLKVEAPEEVLHDFLETRRRLGGDRRDEKWEGVLHMVPSPTESNQYLALKLGALFMPLAEKRGLRCALELSLYRHAGDASDYRNPDIMVYAAPSGPHVERAELVVEVLSPGDESHAKIPWYFERGVREVILLDPATRVPELRKADGSAAKDRVRSEVLGCSFEIVDGPRLRIAWESGEAAI